MSAGIPDDAKLYSLLEYAQIGPGDYVIVGDGIICQLTRVARIEATPESGGLEEFVAALDTLEPTRTLDLTGEERGKVALGLKLLRERQRRLNYGDPDETKALMMRFRAGGVELNQVEDIEDQITEEDG